ncbi:MAG: sulfurtransferase complex subunit TusB [Pseudomonadota bacterium]
MILHTVNAPPGSGPFEACLRCVAAKDQILLLGDGVYALTGSSDAINGLVNRGVGVHYLLEDVQALGVVFEPSIGHAVDVSGFVELTERCTRQLAWYV